MPRFWNRKIGFSGYDAKRLVRQVARRHVPSPNAKVHLICDIDKTYLETKFESVRDLISVAFESADEKITVAGAKDILLAARWGDLDAKLDQGYPRGLHFVSSSPPQMRHTLERKLLLDSLDWDSDTFKDQAYNIMKGRVGLLKNHVGYKTLAILNILKSRDNEEFILIGDNAEYDLFIYLGVTFYSHGILSAKQFIEFLNIAVTDDETLETLERALADPISSRVKGVLIRNAPGYKTPLVPGFTDVIGFFDNYFQAATYLAHLDVIEEKLLPKIAQTFHNNHLFNLSVIKKAIDYAQQKNIASSQNGWASKVISLLDLDKIKAIADQNPISSLQPPIIMNENFGLTEFRSNGPQVLELARKWVDLRSHFEDKVPTK